MAVYLRDLVARAPAATDLAAVEALFAACAQIEGEREGHQEDEDLRACWQRADFHLSSDAWLILTRRGEVIGYGAVWSMTDGTLEGARGRALAFCVRVHPAYRERGIGTLLLRLAEQRARTLAEKAGAARGDDIWLTTTVAYSNHAARALLEREGYQLRRSFWQIVIDGQASAAWPERGRLTLKLELEDERDLIPAYKSPARLLEPTGRTTARHYCCYEKLLLPGPHEGALETTERNKIEGCQ
ncbi:GNAT family N-acetyltransferase [Thermogemmatispora sp.]|uniref:GNAT family N-acetyltransferase n=1 Tax=Thermogemmatispora sp. TaxID=1968838 RepID=UPI001D8B7187|nr:GNAT family N-acetyltransferase [Thermogemmatispora sp.]MBX5449514.1 GNAT family N-acetyltransferase [Thermogemmatispora sp.]